MTPTAANYHSLKQEIGALAKECGRDPREITLVAVSKTYTWDHVQPVYGAGCRDFGENRVQELLEKQAVAPQDVRWHLIGTLQKNKVKKVVGKVALIHSVDSIELAEEISRQSVLLGVHTAILLQVNTSGEASKQGMSVAECEAGIERVRALPAMTVEGLMTMAPLTEDKAVIRQCFGVLRELRDRLGLKQLSMGMSNDYVQAVQEGATLLRVGSSIFGKRTG